MHAARSQIETDQANAAKLREEIEAATKAKGSALAPIERDAIKLALADADAPGTGQEQSITCSLAPSSRIASTWGRGHTCVASGA